MRKDKYFKAKKLIPEGKLSLDFAEEEPEEVITKNRSGDHQPIKTYTIGPEGDENTILIKRTLRSGQSIKFPGNVVVLGDINPGSEIIASGNIIVMGSLRGVVHAGAEGDETATVAAFKLHPTQLRIANHITRAPDGDNGMPEQPEVARIKDGVVIIEAYHVGQEKQMKIC